MYQAKYDETLHCINILKNGINWFAIPVATEVNGTVYSPKMINSDDLQLLFSENNAAMLFKLHDDCIEVSFSVQFNEDTSIFEAKYFKDHICGLRIGHFDRALTTQPRINNCHNNTS